MARRKRRTGGRGGIPAAADSPRQVSKLPMLASEALSKNEDEVTEVAPAGDAAALVSEPVKPYHDHVIDALPCPEDTAEVVAACGCDKDKHERSLDVDKCLISGYRKLKDANDQVSHDHYMLKAEVLNMKICKKERIAINAKLSVVEKMIKEALVEQVKVEKMMEARAAVVARRKMCEHPGQVDADDVQNEEESLGKIGDVKEEAQAEEGGKKCWRCSCSSVKTLLCVGCRRARYCDSQCQEENWDKHWEYCHAKNNKRAFKEFRFMSTKIFA